MTISILYPTPANPIIVPVGELMGCLSAWVSVFRPQDNFMITPIPRYLVMESLLPILTNGPHRLFGLDVILRSIAQSYRSDIQIQDTAQATPDFVDQNNIYLNNCYAQSLKGTNAQGVRLTQEAIDVWCQYNRSERLKYLKFGFDRLEWIIRYVGLDINLL